MGAGGGERDFLLTGVRACSVASVMSDSVQLYRLQLTRLPVHGILQARILEWVAMPSSRGSS